MHFTMDYFVFTEIVYKYISWTRYIIKKALMMLLKTLEFEYSHEEHQDRPHIYNDITLNIQLHNNIICVFK